MYQKLNKNKWVLQTIEQLYFASLRYYSRKFDEINV